MSQEKKGGFSGWLGRRFELVENLGKSLGAYPIGMYSGIRKMHTEIVSASAREQQVGNYVLGAWTLIFALLAAWVWVFSRLGDTGRVIGSVPVFLVALLFFKGQHLLRGFVRGLLEETGRAVAETKTPLPRLRLLARTRLADVDAALTEWKQLPKDEGLIHAPVLACRIIQILGPQFEEALEEGVQEGREQ